MIAIKIDDNMNPVMMDGRFVWVQDIFVVEQNCRQAMKQSLGELAFDYGKGIDYFNNVFTASPNWQKFEAQARLNILKVDGVTGISSFTYEQTESLLSYELVIKTIYGEKTINASV